jgi:hypothetical protein
MEEFDAGDAAERRAAARSAETGFPPTVRAGSITTPP